MCATLTYSAPETPEPSRTATPPLSLIHTARAVLPAANLRTTAGTGVGDDGKDTAPRLGTPDDSQPGALGWTPVEPVYGTIIQLARLIWRIQGLRLTVEGVENIPKSGGAVIAINHTGYLDFTFAGLPVYKQGLGRKVRFMAKQEVFDHKISGPIMRSLRHISVNRQNGAASYEEAVRNLKDGELVGVYPEATISRSFEIKEFKSGAARMAVEAGVPIVPVVVWGAQRIWTKGHPRKLFRPKVPVVVLVGEPIEPTLGTAELTTLLHSRMQQLLERAQELYGSHPAGEFWVPRRLGGGAPSLAEAARLEAQEAAERAARRNRSAEPPGQ